MRIAYNFIHNRNGWNSGAGPNYYFLKGYPHLHMRTDGTQQTPKIQWIKVTFGDGDLRNIDVTLKDNTFSIPYIIPAKRPPADILKAMEEQIEALNESLVPD